MSGRGGRGRRNGGRGNAAGRMRQELNHLKTALQGAKSLPSPVPRTFIQYPWNSWTFEAITATTGASQLVRTIVQNVFDDIAVKLQLGSTVGGPQEYLKIKVQSAQVWATASGLIYPNLRADFYEINQGTGGINAASIRSTQVDKGTLNVPARAGYVFPVSDSKDVLNEGDKTLRIVDATPLDSGTVVTTRIHVLWVIRKATPNTAAEEQLLAPDNLLEGKPGDWPAGGA